MGTNDTNISQTKKAATTLPPVRGQKPQSNAPLGAKAQSQSIPGGDFEAWEKYDVDKAIQDANQGSSVASEKTVINSAAAHLPAPVVKEIPADAGARHALAMREKDKGNECYRAGDLDEAAVYYSRSLTVDEIAATRNNRAMVYIKLKKFRPALEDTERVLAVEPQNVKALVRKASALVGLGQKAEAYVAAKRALQLQPNNKEAHRIAKECATAVGAPKKKRMVIEDVDGNSDDDAKPEQAPPTTAVNTKQQARRIVIEEDSEDDDDDSETQLPASIQSAQIKSPQVRRVQIEEVDSSDEDEEELVTPSTAAPAPPVVEGPPPPPAVLRLKETGGEAFRAGQYATAADFYSQALEVLRTEEVHSTEVEATLLSNRAACSLKDGSCRAAIADCTAGLALNTQMTGKLLLRRAAAFEASEHFDEGYADFQAALRMHPDSQVAQVGLNRCCQALRHLHGTGWRKVVDAVGPRPTAQSMASATRPIAPGSEATATTAQDLAPTPETTHSTSDQAPSSAEFYETEKERGNALTKDGKFEEAIACYDRCVDIDPTASAALNNRALCNLRLGNWSAATRDATAVLTIEPSNPKALLRRAKGLAGLAQYKAAEESARECLALQPSNKACAELLESIRAERAKSDKIQTLVDEDPELAALKAKRDALEAERRSAEAALNEMQGKVASVSGQVSGLKESMADKEKQLGEASETIRNSVGEMVDDVMMVAKSEGDERVMAEAVRAKKQVEAALAEKNKKAKAKETPAKSSGNKSREASAAPSATSSPPQSSKKWSPAEFMKSMVKARRDPKALCDMLATVNGKELPKLFSNRLEAVDITAVFAALRHAQDPGHTYAILQGMSRVQRFDMVAMFLEDKDWELADPVFETIKTAATRGDVQGVSVADVEHLRTHFH